MGCSDGGQDLLPDAGPAVDGPLTRQDGGNPPVKKDGAVNKDTGAVKKDTGAVNKDTGAVKKDTGGVNKDTGVKPDTYIKPDSWPTLSKYKVAAVQYGSGHAASVKQACTSDKTPNVCALRELVARAKQAGALFVVLPEYALGKDQQYYEPTPKVGDNPATNSAWPADLLIKIFSQTARSQGVYLVLNLHTYRGTKPNYRYYNTQVAFDPAGKVLATHHKFNLFGNESQSLTAGSDVTVFNTPLGKVGLLICADIYGSSALRQKLTKTLGARVVLVSSYWTVSNSVSWYTSFTKRWNVYTVVANTTHSPGYGGGIYAPSGSALVEKIQGQPSVLISDIPAP